MRGSCTFIRPQGLYHHAIAPSLHRPYTIITPSLRHHTITAPSPQTDDLHRIVEENKKLFELLHLLNVETLTAVTTHHAPCMISPSACTTHTPSPAAALLPPSMPAPSISIAPSPAPSEGKGKGGPTGVTKQTEEMADDPEFNHTAVENGSGLWANPSIKVGRGRG